MAAGVSADRIATTAVSGTAAIVASQEAVGRLVTKLEAIEKLVSPLPVEHATIIRNQEGLLTAVGNVAAKAGTGCRAS